VPSARRVLAVAFAALIAAAPSRAAVKEADLMKQIDKLSDLPAAQQTAAMLKLAHEIESMPAGLPKVRVADALTDEVTDGRQEQATLQAVANVLSEALAESPIPDKGDEPDSPYMDLARLVRYLGATTSLANPKYVKATQVLEQTDADIQKQDFTLKDMHNKPVTLSALKGKIVMVNFWATWCESCRAEMPLLSALYDHFQSQDLVVVSITDEDGLQVAQFLGGAKFHPWVLLDPGGKVNKQFHIHSIPATFIFDRDGKLIGQTIDQGSPKLFVTLLSKTNLHLGLDSRID
jgi:thiol-disulfide isomerase/thioredoxin